MHLTLQKAEWEANAICVKNICKQYIETISKYKWTNALGFELQNASNLHKDKKTSSKKYKQKKQTLEG